MGSPTHSPAASPAKGKAKAKPAPAAKQPKGMTKRTGRKPAAKKGGRGKGRGHKKTYPDPLTQAAHERQKVLRENFSQVGNAILPGLVLIADQSLEELTSRPDAHEDCDEFITVQETLDALYNERVESIELEHRTRNSVAEREYKLESDRINKCFTDSFNYVTDEFIDGALNRTSILDELRHEGCPITTPDLTYTYVGHIPYVSCTGEANLDQAHILEKARQEKIAAKRKAIDELDEEPDSKRLRHTGGLLASEQQPDGVSESNAPSPTPDEEQDVAPTSSKALPDLPNGSGEPDEFGVRRVKRRARSPANRFIVPQTFQWDEDEIGFRDSTNDSTRRATRRSRGVFLNKPNSRAWHFDHTVKDYDCREYTAETLDSELVQKHGLHPRYGFFLPTSTNEPEPPSERVDGSRPIVHVPDRGTTDHASRSVRPMKMDRMLQEDATKGLMASMLSGFCEEEDIDQEEIVTSEMRERELQARERLVVLDDHGVPMENSDHSQPDSNVFLRERVTVLLEAASELDGQPAAPPSPPSPRQSRPYDAVRDVFTGTEPAPRPEQHSEASTNPLDVLAGVADEVSRSESELRPKGKQRVDRPEMEPRGHVSYGQQSSASNSSSNFLQTALNPASTYTPIAPAPAPSLEVTQQATPHRIPFANQNGIKDSPGLPPLRPNRSDTLGKASHSSPQLQPLPPPLHQSQEFGSPHGLVHTNSGTYYPPAPARAYHHGLSFPEPPMMPMTIQGQPMHGPGMMANQSPLNHHAPLYHVMSPSMHVQAQLAPMPQMEPPAPSVSPPGPPMLAPSPPAHATRQRTSVSSNGNSAGRQFRRIAAAPASNNRPWQTNGGTELRLAHYDHKEAIKDYRANEPPPRTGPTTIRGWNVNNVSKGRNRGARKEDSEEKDSPNTISPFIGKWNASERS
ncbi:uncharacterized protein F4807DRAFT_411325 [Annulohypoxylon truncatum]|uniref:uncharacterized protein n=1 Tax=Annulohypoxylon truncatum TaxID=327061 RepID=UPI002007535D|nr:uncharacterized protein F4807DRAFT_411325 [Annulohypoxylon truncatum]KAI1213494.1 hypothetical protein F4807DRAFT_411325 [Annulohypoxylon truncatum]